MRTRHLAPVVLLALLASSCSFLPGFGPGMMTVEAEFSRAFNLFPQSPVRVRGVEVGLISDVSTDPGSDTVLVEMRLEDDVEIPADSGAIVITSALLGERYVQFAGGTSDQLLADGDSIPVERTQVPFEFDEVLEGLNDFVGGLEGEEVGRLVGNLAQLLDGQGEQLGQTIDSAAGAVDALKEVDEELVSLASSVADLNDTLVTRDQELAALLDDWISVTDTLTAESTDLDGALDGLVVLNRELAELMLDHREDLSADIDTLTRVGRTVDRNLDNFSLGILSAAELFRHAERVVDREENYLPLVNHTTELATSIEESLQARLQGLCLNAGGSEEQCGAIDLSILDELTAGGSLCLPPLVPCGDTSATIADALVAAVEQEPLVGDGLLALQEERATDDEDEADDTTGPSVLLPDDGDDEDGGSLPSSAVDEALERLGLGLGGAR